jgi:sialidase-1
MSRSDTGDVIRCFREDRMPFRPSAAGWRRRFPHAVTTALGVTAVLGVVAWLAVPARHAPDQTPARAASCTTSVPFAAGDDGYNTFRIPAIVRTRAGTLLAFAEGRVNSAGDSGNIDTVLKRSTDGGCTWSALSVVEDAGGDTAGNPTPVVLSSGRIVLLTTRNAGNVTQTQIVTGQVTAAQSRRPYVQYSDDDGKTWSIPVDITDQAKQDNWRWYATGPGHAVQLTGGPHAGRIVVPANHTYAPPAGSSDTGAEPQYNGGHDIYSDDGGNTWHIGFVNENSDGYINPNESIAAELPDGRIYFNTRNDSTAPAHRADAYSSDGGTTLDEKYRPQGTISTAVCQNSVLQLSNKDMLVESGPLTYGNDRVNMTLRTSTDDGLTWQVAKTLSGLPAAYSDLVQADSATVGVLYETGDFSAYSRIEFARVPISELAG